TVAITVGSVNDAPRFTAGAGQKVLGFAPRAIPSWAANNSAGPADEAGQARNFVGAADDKPAPFSSPPAVSPDPTLTFTPSSTGTAPIAVALHDDGGTTFGGIDTSAPQTFTIMVASTVTAVDDSANATAGLVTVIRVLANDFDTDGDTLTIASVTI